jgi:PAS domain S-box-containing protein
VLIGGDVKSGWKWDTLDPLERRVAELLVQGKSNAAICAEVFLSRARVQNCIKKILIKTGADSTRGAIALLLEERENMSLVRLLDQMSDGVAILQDRLVKFVNTALERILGHELEEIAEMPFVELVAPRSKDAQAKNYDLRMRGEPFPGSYVARILYKGGQEKDVTITSAGVIRYGGRPAFLAFVVPHVSEE